MTGYVATAETVIRATPHRVWQSLTDPELIAQYMFGSRVETGWRAGDPIVWKGEYDGKLYEDKGEILLVEPERRLAVSHYSPLSGVDDVPENYHTVTYTLAPVEDGTLLSLSQDNNASQDEAEHSQATWEQMLAGLRQVAEQARGPTRDLRRWRDSVSTPAAGRPRARPSTP